MKICSNCRVSQPKENFYKNKATTDRLASWCKNCYLLRNREEYRVKLNREWKKKNKYGSTGLPRIKRNAKQRVLMAVKSGRLKKGICEKCGEPKVEGHHEDYSKPLEVKWLCGKHHRERHNAIRQEMGGGE